MRASVLLMCADSKVHLVLHKMKNDTQHLQNQFLFLMVQKLVFSQVHLMLHKMAPANTYKLCSGIYLFPRTEMQDADKIPLLCDAETPMTASPLIYIHAPLQGADKT